jgi:hypothetical protein
MDNDRFSDVAEKKKTSVTPPLSSPLRKKKEDRDLGNAGKQAPAQHNGKTKACDHE